MAMLVCFPYLFFHWRFQKLLPESSSQSSIQMVYWDLLHLCMNHKMNFKTMEKLWPANSSNRKSIRSAYYRPLSKYWRKNLDIDEPSLSVKMQCWSFAVDNIYWPGVHTTDGNPVCWKHYIFGTGM